MTDTATPPADDPLADLLVRAGAGDGTALAAVYDATSARVHGLALHVVGDAGVACDVVRETFAELASPTRPFDPSTGTATAWVVALAHRFAVARRRLLAPVSTSAPDRDVPAQVAELPEAERRVVQLAYLEGRTCAEVALISEVTAEAAAVRLRSAMYALRSAQGGPRVA